MMFEQLMEYKKRDPFDLDAGNNLTLLWPAASHVLFRKEM